MKRKLPSLPVTEPKFSDKVFAVQKGDYIKLISKKDMEDIEIGRAHV